MVTIVTEVFSERKCIFKKRVLRRVPLSHSPNLISDSFASVYSHSDLCGILKVQNTNHCVQKKNHTTRYRRLNWDRTDKVLFRNWIIFSRFQWGNDINRYLHRYRRGHGFKSRTGLNFFRSYYQLLVSVVFLAARISYYFSLHKTSRNRRAFSLKGVILCERTHPFIVSCEVELIDDIALLRENEPAFV